MPGKICERLQRLDTLMLGVTFVLALVVFFIGPLKLEPSNTKELIFKVVIVTCYGYALFAGLGRELVKRVVAWVRLKRRNAENEND